MAWAQLTKTWRILVALYGLTLITGAIALYYLGMASPWCWLGLSTGAAIYVLFEIRRLLPLNRDPQTNALYPDLGAANALTVARGALLVLMVGFLCPGPLEGMLRWVPAVLYTLIAIVDHFDGYLARISGRVTRMGEALDISLDGLGVLVVTALAVRLGQLPWPFLIIGLARYLFLFGTWLLRRTGRPLYPMPPNVARRAIASLQMGFLAVVLYPIFSPPATTIVGLLFLIPFLGGFLRDFFAVAGWIDSNGVRISSRWLPAGLHLLRWGTAALALWMSRPSTANINAPPWSPILLTLAAVLLIPGVVSRGAAILILIAAGWQVMVETTGVHHVLLFILATAVLFLGGGRAALWSPDDTLLLEKAGES